MQEVVSSFTYVRDKSLWPEYIFLPMLMRHGGPPSGVKFYGARLQMHLYGTEARTWYERIVMDCQAAVCTSDALKEFKQGYRDTMALHVKNQFIRWCRDNRK